MSEIKAPKKIDIPARKKPSMIPTKAGALWDEFKAKSKDVLTLDGVEVARVVAFEIIARDGRLTNESFVEKLIGKRLEKKIQPRMAELKKQEEDRKKKEAEKKQPTVETVRPAPEAALNFDKPAKETEKGK